MLISSRNNLTDSSRGDLLLGSWTFFLALFYWQNQCSVNVCWNIILWLFFKASASDVIYFNRSSDFKAFGSLSPENPQASASKKIGRARSWKQWIYYLLSLDAWGRTHYNLLSFFRISGTPLSSCCSTSRPQGWFLCFAALLLLASGFCLFVWLSLHENNDWLSHTSLHYVFWYIATRSC